MKNDSGCSFSCRLVADFFHRGLSLFTFIRYIYQYYGKGWLCHG